jgi:hypothetical protein
VQLEQLDDLGGPAERIGDRRAHSGGVGGDDRAVGLGHQQLAGRDTGRVECGEPLEGLAIRAARSADEDGWSGAERGHVHVLATGEGRSS